MNRTKKIENILNCLKKVVVEFPDNNSYNFILIEDEDDLLLYEKAYNLILNRTLISLVNNPLKGLNSLEDKKDLKSQLVFNSTVNNESLLSTVYNTRINKLKGMRKLLYGINKPLIINQVGGYQYLSDDMKIIDSRLESDYNKIFN